MLLATIYLDLEERTRATLLLENATAISTVDGSLLALMARAAIGQDEVEAADQYLA